MYDKQDDTGRYASIFARDRAEGFVSVARQIGIRNLTKPAYRLVRAEARMLSRGLPHDDGVALLLEFDAGAAPASDPRSAELQSRIAALHDPYGPEALGRLLMGAGVKSNE